MCNFGVRSRFLDVIYGVRPPNGSPVIHILYKFSYVFIHIFMQIFMSFLSEQLKQQIMLQLYSANFLIYGF